MCHAFLTDTNFYQLLFRIDQSIAEEVRERGCECGGALHAAPYPRKPRGLRSALDDSHQSRLSFCCAQDGCRRALNYLDHRWFSKVLQFHTTGQYPETDRPEHGIR